jgi:hypothetical protein
METIAIYREDIIKTYGLAERTGLCLATIDLPIIRMDQWGSGLMDGIARSGLSLVLFMAQPEGTETLRLYILMEGPQQDLARPSVLRETFPGPWRFYPAAELIAFQGPHYGDRYGIAGAALKALNAQDVPILGLICSGASVYLITPEGKAGEARRALGEAFMIPERTGEGSEP